MNVFAMGSLIVASCAAIPVLIVWLVQRGKLKRVRAAADGRAAAELRLAAIEARLAALEAITVSPAYRLAEEFQDLERIVA